VQRIIQHRCFSAIPDITRVNEVQQCWPSPAAPATGPATHRRVERTQKPGAIGRDAVRDPLFLAAPKIRIVDPDSVFALKPLLEELRVRAFLESFVHVELGISERFGVLDRSIEIIELLVGEQFDGALLEFRQFDRSGWPPEDAGQRRQLGCFLRLHRSGVVSDDIDSFKCAALPRYPLI
jgi:hypothetical protein